MHFLPQHVIAQLLDNGKPENRDRDHAPVVFLELLGTDCAWLISEIDPDDFESAFGLCDLGMGFPELGYVHLSEILALQERLGCIAINIVILDTKHPMSAYATAARRKQAITLDLATPE